MATTFCNSSYQNHSFLRFRFWNEMNYTLYNLIPISWVCKSLYIKKAYPIKKGLESRPRRVDETFFLLTNWRDRRQVVSTVFFTKTTARSRRLSSWGTFCFSFPFFFILNSHWPNRETATRNAMGDIYFRLVTLAWFCLVISSPS